MSQNQTSSCGARPLPDAGITALLSDGQNPAVMAVALDIPVARVRALVTTCVLDLAAQAGIVFDTANEPILPVRRLRHYLACISDKLDTTWEVLLTPREVIEVAETRAYFNAFLKSNELRSAPNVIQINSRP